MSDTLDLVLMGKWYDMIERGEKLEEYRACTKYWEKRLFRCPLNMPKFCSGICHVCGVLRPKEFTKVRFHRGYTNIVMVFQITEIRRGFGFIKWGAPNNSFVFIIALGKRII